MKPESPTSAPVGLTLFNLFFAAQRTGFGHGPCRRYAEAWHESFGLLTDREDEVILRIKNPPDRAAFRKDVLKPAEGLRQPLGYGADLKLVPKYIAVSGSLAASQWDAPLAHSIVELGMPMLMLPSLAKAPPEIANEAIINFIATCFPRKFNHRVDEPNNLIPNPWFDEYGHELRIRLRCLPATYEHATQKLVEFKNYLGGFPAPASEFLDDFTG